ncbi:MAG: response regulator transcription factor [Actinomycetes bacterium]
MATENPTSVILVDDHELIRQGLRRAFDRSGEFTVLAEAGSIAEAKKEITQFKPDVVIVDIRLPDGSGLDLVKELRKDNAEMGIVVLSMYSDDQYLFSALDNGASAFVSKDAPAEDVMAAARHASAMPSSFSAPNLAEAMQRRLSPTGPQLSPREREVLNLLADGLGVAEISKQLYISQSTTKTHVGKLYEKLGAANRAQALMTALRLGLITSEGRG